MRHERDPLAVAAALAGARRARRASASAQLVIEVTARSAFVGSAATVAETIDEYVQADAADGYILVPHLTPHGLDHFVDEVVPLLQERGVFRADYAGTTLRDHLGLARPARAAARRRRRLGGRWLTPTRSLALVGAGPTASSLLERLAANAPELLGDGRLQVHLVDPYRAGTGRVWRADLHPLLWMNSMAEDVTMFTDDSVRCDGPHRPGPSLYEWAAAVDDAHARRAGAARRWSPRSAASAR